MLMYLNLNAFLVDVLIYIVFWRLFRRMWVRSSKPTFPILENRFGESKLILREGLNPSLKNL